MSNNVEYARGREPTLPRYFTHYWQNETWEHEKQRTLSGDSGFLEHAADSKFRERGVSSGDFVYPVTIMKGTLYVMCRLEVDQVCDFDEAADILGTTDLWEADDHIVATHPAPKHFGLAVPLETTRRLQFLSGNDTKSLAFKKSSTELDQNTLRNVRVLHPDSAAELDKLLAPIDGPEA